MIRRTTAVALLVLGVLALGAGSAAAQECAAAICARADGASGPQSAAGIGGPLPSGSAVVEGTPPVTDESKSTGPLGVSSGPTPNGAAAALAGGAGVGSMLLVLARLRRARVTLPSIVVMEPAPQEIPALRQREVRNPRVFDAARR